MPIYQYPSQIRWCSEKIEKKEESELASELKQRLKEKKLLQWKPGQKLTNAQILSLFRSYSQKNKLQDVDNMKKVFQHPLLHVYGFDRREFIQGTKQALHMISESVSSPRFRAFTYG